ncbi:hypothetical protein TGRH88_023870 [Toxoplasma gondii]|uniref:Sulfite exporter TauE/SafE protein n=1 Tax=Toxoplasma gondii TaxID=5811 RepID=A0A7J6K832_TOXGO|nr:hypothetical protein TGRH88_023870 [Toxoplasma gondii]
MFHLGRGGYTFSIGQAHRDLVDEERTLSDLNNGPAIVCVILIAVVGAVSVTAGTGGGAIFVPLMQLLMRFNTFEATATSQCLMTGSSLAGLILNFIRRNPVVDMPLIDMDMVLLLGPMQMCGSSIGVIVNRVLPAWLIIVLLVVCLLYETIRLMRRLCDQPKRARNETQLTAAEHTQQTRGRLGMAVPVEDQQSAGEMGVTTRKAAGDEEKKQDGNETQKEQKTSGIREDDVCENQEVLVSSEDEHVIHKEERDTQAAALDSDDRRRRKTEFETIKYLWERHELTKWSILLTIWTINLTITFIKGGKRSTVHVVPFCSVSYWIIYVVGCLFLATASLLWGYKLLKRHKKRLRLHQLCYSSIEFTPDNVQFLLAQAFFAGMLGAIVGIGGGLILGPALLLKGVVPSVSSSLTSCLVLLSASTAGTINLTSRMAPPSISGVLFLVLFFTTLVGKSLLDRLIRKHKLERLLVVLMASIMCCSIGCSIVAGTVDGIKGPKSRQEFKLPCDR